MWLDYTATVKQHTVVGDLRIYRDLYSPQLRNRRDVLVWLPPDYARSGQGCPVIYMHDGQNLFDAYTSYSGEWRVDETLTALSAEGRAAIVVGLPNQNELRRLEYSPYTEHFGDMYLEGRGDDYIRFITDTVKPLIDGSFRTRPEAAMTGIAGSSMGGLISLHGFLTRQDVFGFCGAFSPVFWIGTGLQETIARHAAGYGKIYLDIGGREGEVVSGPVFRLTDDVDSGHNIYVEGVRQLHHLLVAGGYRDGENLRYVEDPDALHNEAAWARRLPDALRFLLPPAA